MPAIVWLGVWHRGHYYWGKKALWHYLAGSGGGSVLDLGKYEAGKCAEDHNQSYQLHISWVNLCDLLVDDRGDYNIRFMVGLSNTLFSWYVVKNGKLLESNTDAVCHLAGATLCYRVTVSVSPYNLNYMFLFLLASAWSVEAVHLKNSNFGLNWNLVYAKTIDFAVIIYFLYVFITHSTDEQFTMSQFIYTFDKMRFIPKKVNSASRIFQGFLKLCLTLLLTELITGVTANQ